MATEGCRVNIDSEEVASVQEKYLDQIQLQADTYYNRYLCEHLHSEGTLQCTKYRAPQTDCSRTDTCWEYQLTQETSLACSFGYVGVVWSFNQQMNGSYIDSIIQIQHCRPGCISVNSHPHLITGPEPATSMSETRMSIPPPQEFTGRPTSPPVTMTTSQTTPVNKADNVYKAEDDGDKKGIVIGVVAAVVILAAVVAFLSFLFWRRRKTASFSKFGIGSSSKTHPTPVAVQLQTMEAVYANDDLFRGVKNSGYTKTSEDSKGDVYSVTGFSDGTDYEDNFSDYYNDYGPSRESSMYYANHSFEPDNYENCTRTETGHMDSADKNRTCNLPMDASKMEDYADELIYEDLDCSAFENIHSSAEHDDDVQHNSSSKVREEEVEEEKENSGFNDTVETNNMSNDKQTGVLSSSIPNASSGSGHPVPALGGYSRLNEGALDLGDSYNIDPNSLDDQHEEPSTDPIQSMDATFGTKPSRIRSSAPYDPIEVIDISHSPDTPVKNESSDTFLSRNPGVSESSDATHGSRSGVAGPESDGKLLPGKKHEYFELESDYESDISDVGDIKTETFA